MTPQTKRNIRTAFKIFIFIYLLVGILLFFMQDLLLFHPTALPKTHIFSFSQPFEEVNIAVDKRNVSVLKFPTGSIRKGIVLFFHGNMQHAEHYKEYPSFFTQNGYEIWMPDYPGFGKSTGKRTEENMYKDAVMLYDLALKIVPSDRIVIYGKSIGTGVAAYLASIHSARRLILETPYCSISALGRHYFPVYPVMPITRYVFPIYQYLKKVKAPISIFSGSDDGVIPHKQAIQLKEENKQVELITIAGGRHNNLSGFKLFRSKLDSLLNQ